MNNNNEEKAKNYANKKALWVSAGTGAMIGNAAFGIWDSVNANFDCGTAVITTGIIALCVTGFALLKENPYVEKNIDTNDEFEDEDEKEEVLTETKEENKEQEDNNKAPEDKAKIKDLKLK